MQQPINASMASTAVSAKALLLQDASHFDQTMVSNTSQTTVAELARVALQYTCAVRDTEHHKEQLHNAYRQWRCTTGTHEFIARNSPEWAAMMQATSEQYRQLRNAKSREYRAQKKLLAMAKKVEGKQ